MNTIEIKITFPATVLEKAIRLFDRVTGSEPLNRYAVLYSEKALRMRATDGTLVADLAVSAYRPLKDSYVLPIDPLRHFLKGKKEDVELVVGKEVMFASRDETLVIRAVKKKKPSPLHKPHTSIQISRSLLHSTLDFSTAHLDQGDHIYVLARAGELVCIGISNSHTACSRMIFPVPDPACFMVPYESIRHLVKTLELVNRKAVLCGILERGVALSIGGLEMFLHGAKCETDSVQEITSFLLDYKSASFWTVELLKIKRVLSRAARIQKLAPAQATIRLGADRISISVTYEQTVFTSSTEPLYVENPKPFEIALRTDKLSSLLARINTKRIFFELTEKGLIVTDRSRKAVLISFPYT